MTDDEILEQINQYLETGYCTRNWSNRELAMLIQSLINRQKTRIEELEKGELSKAMTFNSATIKRGVNEAVKEFAEKIKGYIAETCIMSEDMYAEVNDDINRLVKEMTEGENG